VIFWRPGQGPRFVGCGWLLLLSVVIALLVYTLSSGRCTVFIFP
jgi:hypothetical protein